MVGFPDAGDTSLKQFGTQQELSAKHRNAPEGGLEMSWGGFFIILGISAAAMLWAATELARL